MNYRKAFDGTVYWCAAASVQPPWPCRVCKGRALHSCGNTTLYQAAPCKTSSCILQGSLLWFTLQQLRCVTWNIYELNFLKERMRIHWRTTLTSYSQKLVSSLHLNLGYTARCRMYRETWGMVTQCSPKLKNLAWKQPQKQVFQHSSGLCAVKTVLQHRASVQGLRLRRICLAPGRWKEPGFKETGRIIGGMSA